MRYILQEEGGRMQLMNQTKYGFLLSITYWLYTSLTAH